MTTHSENTATINFPIDTVWEALSSADYWNYEAQEIGDEPGEVNSFSADPAVEVVLFEVLPTAALPEAVRAMVSQALKLKRVVTFSPVVDEQSTGAVKAEVKGAPVKFESQVTAKQEGDKTTLHAESTVDVNIPMMGQVLEPKVAEWIEDFLTREAALVEKWIAENK